MSKVIQTPAKFYFLELLRSLAALYVVCVHLQQILDFGKAGSILFGFGQEAVMIFFVLSGFVIYYSVEKKKDIDQRKYLKARILRIYPVFIIACMFAYGAMCIIEERWMCFPWISFVENIFMLQDFALGKPGTWAHPFMGNTPLWSLSYEWWFYMLFIPVYFYVTENKRYIYIGTISFLSMILYLIIPNQLCLWLSYFILWWLGAEVSRKYLHEKNVSGDMVKVLCVCLMMLATLMVYTIYYRYNNPISFGLFPVLFIRHFVMAILFTVFLWKVPVQKMNISQSNLLVRLAPYTYAIYVFHYPIVLIFEKQGWIYSIYGVCFYLCTIFLSAFLVEEFIQKKLSVLFRKG